MRRLVSTVRKGGMTVQWGCSDCAWRCQTPTVGPFGHRTKKARLAQVRMAYGKHRCVGSSTGAGR